MACVGLGDCVVESLVLLETKCFYSEFHLEAESLRALGEDKRLAVALNVVLIWQKINPLLF